MQLEYPHWTTCQSDFIPPRRCVEVIENELHGEATLFNPQNGNTHHLNQTSFAIWRLCDGRMSAHGIAEHLTTIFDVRFEIALDHVEQLVALLAESELLDIPGGEIVVDD